MISSRVMLNGPNSTSDKCIAVSLMMTQLGFMNSGPIDVVKRELRAKPNPVICTPEYQ